MFSVQKINTFILGIDATAIDAFYYIHFNCVTHGTKMILEPIGSAFFKIKEKDQIKIRRKSYIHIEAANSQLANQY